MTPIRNLELHVTHTCNLACEGCSHYSNQGHKGILALEEAERWMKDWHNRLAPRTLSLLGGEPTVHPDLPAFIPLARRHFPKAHLRLVTNGFFLHRHPTLPKALQADPNACIYLSVHHDSPEYLEKVKPVAALLKGWVRDYGIRVQSYQSFKNWTRRYKGIGSDMEPFQDGQIRESWERCPAKYCSQLYEGSLWKCAPLAYLKLQDDKFGLSDKWKPYLGYQPLPPECTDEQLVEFYRREEEPACGMCPAKPEKFTLPLPLTPVRIVARTRT